MMESWQIIKSHSFIKSVPYIFLMIFFVCFYFDNMNMHLQLFCVCAFDTPQTARGIELVVRKYISSDR